MASANSVDLLYFSRSKRDSNLHVIGDLLTDVLQPTVLQPTVLQPTVLQPTVLQPTEVKVVGTFHVPSN
jgi:hypothetical protein